MFEWIWRWLAGWYLITVEPACRAVLADFLFRGEIQFWREKKTTERYSVRIARQDIGKLRALAAENCFPVQISDVHGLPLVLRFCRRRPGIPMGFCILLLWCFISVHWFWRIEITGNDTVPAERIEAVLSELGCGVGDWIPGIDYDWVHARFRVLCPEIAWISVYRHGSVAYVQVREAKRAPEEEQSSDFAGANVIASETGEIVSFRVFEGECVVQIGDVVTPGQLLISGIVPMRHEGQSRLEYAAGEVLAKVACTVSVEMSLHPSQKQYTGREKQQTSVKIFKKKINLFKNAGIPYTDCDTIYTLEQVCLFHRFSIPITIEKTVYREYEMRPTEISAENAAKEAMILLRKKILETVGNGEILSQTVTMHPPENADQPYRIDCLLYCLRDIAHTVPFTVRDTPVGENASAE